MTLTVPASTPLGDYAISIHNYGSPTDATGTTGILHVTSEALATYTITAAVPSDSEVLIGGTTAAGTSSGTLPFNNSTRYFISPVGTTTEYTFTNSGGMPLPYSSNTPPTPGLLSAPNTSTVSNTCTGTALPPFSSCTIVTSTNPPTAGGPSVLLSLPTSFGALTRFYHYASIIDLSVSVTSVLPTNGGALPTVSSSVPSLVDFKESPIGVEQLVTYTLKNNSTYAVPLSPTFSTSNSSYSVKSTTCSSPIAKAATCTVTVGYNPSTPSGVPDPSSLLVDYGYSKILTIPLTGTPIPAYSSSGINLQGLAFYAPLAPSSSATAFTAANNGTVVDTAQTPQGSLALRQYSAYGDVGDYTLSGDTSYFYSRNAFNISVPWRTNYKGTGSSVNFYKAQRLALRLHD